MAKRASAAFRRWPGDPALGSGGRGRLACNASPQTAPGSGAVRVGEKLVV